MDAAALRQLDAEVSTRRERCENATKNLLDVYQADCSVLRRLDAELQRLQSLQQSMTASSTVAPEKGWHPSGPPPQVEPYLVLHVAGDVFRLTQAQLCHPAVRGSRLDGVRSESPLAVDRQPEAFRLLYRYLKHDGSCEIPGGIAACRVLVNELDWWRVDATPVRARLLQER